MILKGRLIAVAVFAIILVVGRFYPIAEPGFFLVLALISPWVIWMSINFNSRMSGFRNVRFGFQGKVSKLYYYLILIPFWPLAAAGVLIGLSSLNSGSLDSALNATAGIAIFFAILYLYFCWPFVQQRLTAFTLNHRRYSQGQFSVSLKVSNYYKIYFKLIGLIIIIGILIAALTAMLKAFGFSVTQIYSDIPVEYWKYVQFFTIAISLIVTSLIIFISKAYL